MDSKQNVQVGDIVLAIKPKNTPLGHWLLGKVIEVYPGKDGHVRLAKVRAGKNQLTRPISKL